MQELFYRYNPWWETNTLFPNLIDRPQKIKELLKHWQSKQIVFLTGLRRVGKTTLFRLLIKQLISVENIEPQHIFYISLDDYALANQTLSQIIDTYRQIHKIVYETKVYIFLDEITYLTDYEIQLKNLYDQQNIKIFASSSSASLLKSKKAYLTGRHTTLEILPLDFDEYLVFKKLNLSASNRHLENQYFEEYLQAGGLPEYIMSGDINYLRELVDDIIHKDIAAVHSIRNLQTLKDYFTLLMERSGKQISINKVAHILDISPDTAKRYLQLFADTYLIYLMPRFGKTNETLLAPQKIYCADLGIRTLFTGFRDKGSLFENYVYLKIKDLKPRYVYQNQHEIDFLTANKTLIESKYQSELTGKQAKLFHSFPALKKLVISNQQDLRAYLSAETTILPLSAGKLPTSP